MSVSHSHIIEKLLIDVQTDSKKLAYAIKDQKDSFFVEELMVLLESILDEQALSIDELVQIEYIDINVDVASNDFEFDVKRQVYEQLAAILPGHILKGIPINTSSKKPVNGSNSKALLEFLQTGNFPWWFNAPVSSKAMEALIYDCIDSDRFIKEFSRELQNLTFKTRSILQLSDGFLEVIFGVLLETKYGVHAKLPKKIAARLEFKNQKNIRLTFWDLLAKIIVNSSKIEKLASWNRFIASVDKLHSIDSKVVTQLDHLMTTVLGKQFLQKQAVVLLKDVIKGNTQADFLNRDHEIDIAKKESLQEKIKSPDTILNDQSELPAHQSQISKEKGANNLDNPEVKNSKGSNQELNNSYKKDAKKHKDPHNVTRKEPLTQIDRDKRMSPDDVESQSDKNEHRSNAEQIYESNDASRNFIKENDSQIEGTGDTNKKDKTKAPQDDPSLTNNDIEAHVEHKNPANQAALKMIDKKLIEQWPKSAVNRDEKSFYAPHCGLLLLHPFLTSFLKNCALLDEHKQLIDPALTAHLLHYLATGNTAAYEYQLRFERFICHIPSGLPMDRDIEIPEKLKTKANELLKAVLGHLPQLKTTAINLLQNEFLSREGKIIIEGENPRIIIERKTQDMLLDSKAWSTSIVKLAWLPNMIYVDW